MEEIKMVDLGGQYRRIKKQIDAALQKVLDSAVYIQGEEVGSFCKNLKAYLNCGHVIPCANGTDALQLAIMALDPEPGDEIILPTHTYVAAAEVITLLKLIPVFIDVDEQTFNLDINQLEDKISRRTKAVIPVHLYGQCADMESILTVADKYGIVVIEDAAQALGAQYTFSDGTIASAGTMGIIGTTSFFPSKNLGGFGDGGAVFTDDPYLAERLMMTANHGQKLKYNHELVGINSRLDTIQAAILDVKLSYLKQYETSRNDVADFYNHNLSKSILQTPFRMLNSSHVFHQYTCKVISGNRDAFQRYLQTNRIPSMIYYPTPLHLQKPYRFHYKVGDFPVAERLAQNVISLPIHTEMSADQLEYICTTINKY